MPVTLNAFFRDWVEEWVIRGNGVSTASGEGKLEVFCLGHDHTVIRGLKQTPSLNPFLLNKQIAQWVQGKNLDLIITNTATASFVSRLRDVGVPIIYFCHGLHWNHAKKLSSLPFILGEVFALKNTAGVIVMNAYDKSWFCRHENLPRLKLKYGVGLNVNEFPFAAPPPTKKKLNLLWAGTLSSRKRPLDVIPLVEALIEMKVPVRLDMLGEGVLAKKFSERIGKLPITMHGQCDPYPFMKNSHLLISTSEWEGLARVALESLAVGRKTIGYKVKGIEDIPESITSGRPGEFGVLAELILNWWRQPNFPIFNREKLSWRNSFEKVDKFIKKTLS